MAANETKLDVALIGGGMITNDLILPSLYHLQRVGALGEINICALNNPPLKMLHKNREIKKAFPGQKFNAFPSLKESSKKNFPTLYKKVIASLDPFNAVVVAMPDQLHYPVIMEALENNQHVLTVKPLVLEYRQAAEIETLAYKKGLFVGVEYHKRFDRRSLIARKDYSLGNFGDFKMGEAKMIEPWFYRLSNFQNWFTCENTDPFTYVGCHYVDLVYFITGLRPVEVSVQGVVDTFPNGKKAYMWANGRVRFENGALLSVTDGLGYPDDGAGSNEQCLTMFCEAKGQSTLIKHNDQFRGVRHCYTRPLGPGGTKFNYVNPDFFKLVPWEGKGFKPVGYGYDSIAANMNMMKDIEDRVAGLDDAKALAARRRMIKETDARGIIATPANSYINELVMEASRRSIQNNGRLVQITYGKKPGIKFA